MGKDQGYDPWQGHARPSRGATTYGTSNMATCHFFNFLTHQPMSGPAARHGTCRLTWHPGHGYPNGSPTYRQGVMPHLKGGCIWHMGQTRDLGWPKVLTLEAPTGKSDSCTKSRWGRHGPTMKFGGGVPHDVANMPTEFGHGWKRPRACRHATYASD